MVYSHNEDVLFEEKAGYKGDLGIITLNRPHVLNCITDQMVRAIYSHLKSWQEAPHIKAVVVRAVPGRAFCAGGDIRLTYDLARNKKPALLTFFYDEFKLNHYLFHFTKPYIAFLDGITMGGGVGISIHGSHRVATPQLAFAMPETAIGFFPDVGGNYFLPRLPGKIGWYLGLTGHTLAADDAVALGLAQHKVLSPHLDLLLEAILQADLGASPKAMVTTLIQQFAIEHTPTPLLAARSALDNCFSKETIEAIQASLLASDNSFCQEAASLLQRRSPTSLKVTLRALNEGSKLDFDQCMQQTLNLAYHFSEGHDFLEGIRAVIIDKDQKPHWTPSTLADVTEEMVGAYFRLHPNLPKL